LANWDFYMPVSVFSSMSAAVNAAREAH